MARSWDEVLGQPIERLHADAPATAGGWRAIRAIDEVSPRPQQPPAVLPAASSMVSVRLPVQPEEEARDSKPGPSLTEQLSLTWANRKARARREHAVEPAWPEWRPEPEPEVERPPEPPSSTTRWPAPLRRAVAVLRRGQPPASETRNPATEGETSDDQPMPSRKPVAETRRSPNAEQRPEETSQKDKPGQATLGGETSLPLTLAVNRQTPIAADERPQAGPASPARSSSPTATPPEQPREVALQAESPEAPRSGADRPPAPDRPALLTRLLRRASTEGRPAVDEPSPAQPRTPATPKGLDPGMAATPAKTEPAPRPALVHRQQPSAEIPALGPAGALGSSPAADPAPISQAESEADAGEPLSPVLRSRMEGLLDVPLREVRVFRTSVSKRLTDRLSADAVTTGNEVHLAPGRGEASIPSGQALLAHELSHYAARQAAGPSPEPRPEPEEQQARAVEAAVRSQPDSFPMSARPRFEAPLEHRLASPLSRVKNDGSPPVGEPFTARGAGQGPSPLGRPAPASAKGVARAPLDRVLEVEPPRATGPVAGAAARVDEGGAGESRALRQMEQDEASFVERVVEAVMRRLRRETALERERRAPFRSEIGG